MEPSNPPSGSPSRSSTPATSNSRFTSQNTTAEDLLKSQTVGLLQLSDFRKRRAEALERNEREAQTEDGAPGSTSRGDTPRDGAATPQPPSLLPAKKKRKSAAKGKLSFGVDDGDEDGLSTTVSTPAAATAASRSQTPEVKSAKSPGPEDGDHSSSEVKARRLGANSSLGPAPKARTKAAMLKESAKRELLRKEFLSLQEAVRASEIVIPFVYYDGTNNAGGACRVKKGDHIWVFLERARKLGAESGHGMAGVGGGAAGGERGGEKERERGRREWARVGVDDLMLVRGDIIVPHHYDFYYFLVNKTVGFNGPLFPYSAQPKAPSGASASADPSSSSSTPTEAARGDRAPSRSGAPLEGADEDPTLTKVVDRRWYERNKHIFPASTWEEFDPGKDYAKGIRRDGSGNAFFF